MTLNDPTIRNMLDNLQESMSNLRDMEQLLLREQEALQNQNTEYMQSIQQQKLQLTEAAELASKNAQSIIKKLGYEPSADGLKHCLLHLSNNNSEIAAIQDNLKEISYRCIRINNKNGQLINAASHEIREILSALRPDSNNQVSTYDIHGKSYSSHSNSYILNTV